MSRTNPMHHGTPTTQITDAIVKQRNILMEAMGIIATITADCEKINKLSHLRMELGGHKKVHRTVLNIGDIAREAIEKTKTT